MYLALQERFSSTATLHCTFNHSIHRRSAYRSQVSTKNVATKEGHCFALFGQYMEKPECVPDGSLWDMAKHGSSEWDANWETIRPTASSPLQYDLSLWPRWSKYAMNTDKQRRAVDDNNVVSFDITVTPISTTWTVLSPPEPWLAQLNEIGRGTQMWSHFLGHEAWGACRILTEHYCRRTLKRE